jgi:hypothetical protein
MSSSDTPGMRLGDLPAILYSGTAIVIAGPLVANN